MFHNNKLLIQLKKKLHLQTIRVEGVVKCTEKNFGFLETDAKKSYFIPPQQMKKVMDGDRIIAVIHNDQDRQIAEPETLIEPFLKNFVGRIYQKDNYLFIVPYNFIVAYSIRCSPIKNTKHYFKSGDWALAKMYTHALKNKQGFYAELIKFIVKDNDNLAPWLVTLSRYNLERESPDYNICNMINEQKLNRKDLTSLDFITIDHASTKDMDDALHVSEGDKNGSFVLTIAIADPTAYIAEGSELDNLAAQRGFTNYLPGLNIPMLPRNISDEICSLHPNKRRPVLVCKIIIESNGDFFYENIDFFVAWIISKAKLSYEHVSNWLEKKGNWKPINDNIAKQILMLNNIYLMRSKWRENNALVFKDRIIDYRFLLDEKYKVLKIIAEPNRIAHRIIEEAMIVANICAAKLLHKCLGFGIYNVHIGFNHSNVEQVYEILKEHNIHIYPESITTLEGFCKMWHILDNQATKFLAHRIRRLQASSEIKTEPGPHFGLGVKEYATWTSPIRKFGDMINHRLLKSIIGSYAITRPDNMIAVSISARRRLNRMAERDISNWLYVNYLEMFIETKTIFSAEVITVSRVGMKVRLLNCGATAFVYIQSIHNIRDELICNQENGTIKLKGKIIFRISDIINVIITEVRITTRRIFARIVI